MQANRYMRNNVPVDHYLMQLGIRIPEEYLNPETTQYMGDLKHSNQAYSLNSSPLKTNHQQDLQVSLNKQNQLTKKYVKKLVQKTQTQQQEIQRLRIDNANQEEVINQYLHIQLKHQLDVNQKDNKWLQLAQNELRIYQDAKSKLLKFNQHKIDLNNEQTNKFLIENLVKSCDSRFNQIQVKTSRGVQLRQNNDKKYDPTENFMIIQDEQIQMNPLEQQVSCLQKLLHDQQNQTKQLYKEKKEYLINLKQEEEYYELQKLKQDQQIITLNMANRASEKIRKDQINKNYIQSLKIQQLQNDQKLSNDDLLKQVIQNESSIKNLRQNNQNQKQKYNNLQQQYLEQNSTINSLTLLQDESKKLNQINQGEMIVLKQKIKIDNIKIKKTNRIIQINKSVQTIQKETVSYKDSQDSVIIESLQITFHNFNQTNLNANNIIKDLKQEIQLHEQQLELQIKQIDLLNNINEVIEQKLIIQYEQFKKFQSSSNQQIVQQQNKLSNQSQCVDNQGKQKEMSLISDDSQKQLRDTLLQLENGNQIITDQLDIIQLHELQLQAQFEHSELLQNLNQINQQYQQTNVKQNNEIFKSCEEQILIIESQYKQQVENVFSDNLELNQKIKKLESLVEQQANEMIMIQQENTLNKIQWMKLQETIQIKDSQLSIIIESSEYKIQNYQLTIFNDNNIIKDSKQEIQLHEQQLELQIKQIDQLNNINEGIEQNFIIQNEQIRDNQSLSDQLRYTLLQLENGSQIITDQLDIIQLHELQLQAQFEHSELLENLYQINQQYQQTNVKQNNEILKSCEEQILIIESQYEEKQYFEKLLLENLQLHEQVDRHKYLEKQDFKQSKILQISQSLDENIGRIHGKIQILEEKDQNPLQYEEYPLDQNLNLIELIPQNTPQLIRSNQKEKKFKLQVFELQRVIYQHKEKIDYLEMKLANNMEIIQYLEEELEHNKMTLTENNNDLMGYKSHIQQISIQYEMDIVALKGKLCSQEEKKIQQNIQKIGKIQGLNPQTIVMNPQRRITVVFYLIQEDLIINENNQYSKLYQQAQQRNKCLQIQISQMISETENVNKYHELQVEELKGQSIFNDKHFYSPRQNSNRSEENDQKDQQIIDLNEQINKMCQIQDKLLKDVISSNKEAEEARQELQNYVEMN